MTPHCLALAPASSPAWRYGGFAGCRGIRLAIAWQQPYAWPSARAHGGGFAQASVCRVGVCGLAGWFGSCDDAVIVELADLGGRQSEDLS